MAITSQGIKSLPVIARGVYVLFRFSDKYFLYLLMKGEKTEILHTAEY